MLASGLSNQGMSRDGSSTVASSHRSEFPAVSRKKGAEHGLDLDRYHLESVESKITYIHIPSL